METTKGPTLLSHIGIPLGVTGINLGLALANGFQYYEPLEDDTGYQVIGVLL